MAAPTPPSLSAAQRRVRLSRIARIARKLGFTGAIEYRHVFSKSGGAQYGQGKTEEDDLLIVYAEAFDRDANPDDYSLTAILAHERGHQLLARHPRIAKMVEGKISAASEEIVASVVGSILCDVEEDRINLMSKAVAQWTDKDADAAFEHLYGMRKILEALL
jgi:hypothetical protein